MGCHSLHVFWTSLPLLCHFHWGGPVLTNGHKDLGQKIWAMPGPWVPVTHRTGTTQASLRTQAPLDHSHQGSWIQHAIKLGIRTRAKLPWHHLNPYYWGSWTWPQPSSWPRDLDQATHFSKLSCCLQCQEHCMSTGLNIGKSSNNTLPYWCTWKDNERWPEILGLCIFGGHVNGVADPWHWSGLTPVAVVTWRVDKQMKDLSILASLSLFQMKTLKI